MAPDKALASEIPNTASVFTCIILTSQLHNAWCELLCRVKESRGAPLGR